MLNRSFRSILSAAAVATAATLGATTASAQTFDGAVYVMTNEFSGNNIVAYGREANGMLTPVGVYPTGGDGAAFDGGEGLDPLISAYALYMTPNNSHVLAVNAGSNTLSVFVVNPDMSLTLTDTQPTRGTGPNSIAFYNGLIYVTNIDGDGVFNGEPDQEGSLFGFRLLADNTLRAMPQSLRQLDNRPSCVQFTPDGRFLVIASINAGSSALASGSNDEIVVYRVRLSGRPAGRPIASAASTAVNNPQGRNLASAIGLDIVPGDNLNNTIVVTEAREFTAAGAPPTFPGLQTGSVSTWNLSQRGQLTPLQLDVLAGNGITDGERTACWIEFNNSFDTFWVSNAIDSSISAYDFSNGTISLIDATVATGTPPDPSNPFGTTDGWIDLWLSDDGNFLYQLYGLDGTVGVFEVNGSSLTLIQEASGNLPDVNTQGIVAF